MTTPNLNLKSRRRSSTIIALLSTLTFAGPAFAQQRASAPDTTYAPSRCGGPVSPTGADSIDRAVLAWMVRSRTPGVSLAIVRHGRVVKEQAYGWGDLVNCLPATVSMRFGIGSISKQITAFGTLVLVQQGKLSLDDPISQFFPESGAAWKSITIRHLLTHTSGIRDSGHDDDIYPQIEFDKKQSITEAELITRLATAPLNFPPGDQFAYSNTGYLLLSLIIQRVSELAFPDWMQKNVFEPLGMHDTRFYDSAEIIPALARGYTKELVAWQHFSTETRRLFRRCQVGGALTIRESTVFSQDWFPSQWNTSPATMSAAGNSNRSAAWLNASVIIGSITHKPMLSSASSTQRTG